LGTTYVRATTSLSDPVAVSLELLGPSNLTTAKLERSRLEPKGQKVQLAAIPRTIDEGIYCLEIPFAQAPATPPAVYVASLQIMLRGHGLGSMIWWRWRTTQAAIGSWKTDEGTYDAIVCLGTSRYRFSVKGAKTTGYDDIDVGLEAI
jgi:hypothetical protein